MIKQWTSHQQYRGFLSSQIQHFINTDPNRVKNFQDSIDKLTSLNLDPLYDALKPYYPAFGRPAKHQAEIFRSFILMVDRHETSVTNWVHTLASDKLLAFLIGCTPDDLPPVGSYYDFIDRLWLRQKTIETKERKQLYTFNRKPTKKLQKHKKLPNKNHGVVLKIKRFFAKGRSFDKRPERLLQEIFALIAVVPSLELGLIDTDNVTVSGDGTCVHCHTSSRGIKVCDCRKNGIYDCRCNRRFADPDAAWGWDSYLGQYFYGHTLYAFSYHNARHKIDLPLVMRFVGANRHDSVSGLVALAELRETTPELNVQNVCFDSANDNYATYELLKQWNLKPFIDLNHDVGAKPTYPSALSITENGVPVCVGGHEMVYNGYCKNRSRIKWRCPLKCGKINECACVDSCSPSPYGRVLYTKPEWDLRLFTPVPRGSYEYRQTYKNRTSSERINNRILNDYHLHDMGIRGLKRFSFFAMAIGINIHLDARIKLVKAAA
jgi:hypothetical protein